MTAMEDWKKNNINGQIAVKLKEIWYKKWEMVYKLNDFEQSLIYQGRDMRLWLKVTGVEVGDIPDDKDYTYTAYLWDLAVCPDYYEAICKLKEEKWFSLEVWDIISLNDCISILWWDYENIKEASEIIGRPNIKDEEKWNEISGRICKDLNKRLSQYYVIKKYWRLYLVAKNPESKWGVVKKDDNFMKNMREIKEYFDSKLPEIKREIEEVQDEERKKKEEIMKHQAKRANDLQNQL